jgi:hypothetical protein
MAKYDPLAAHLNGVPDGQRTTTVTFREIAAIAGGLPPPGTGFDNGGRTTRRWRREPGDQLGGMSTGWASTSTLRPFDSHEGRLAEQGPDASGLSDARGSSLQQHEQPAP